MRFLQVSQRLVELLLAKFLRLDLFMNFSQFLILDRGELVEKKANGGDDEDEAEDGGDEIRFFLIEALPLEGALGHEVQLYRTMSEIAESEPDDFTKGMRHASQIFQIQSGIDLDVAQGVKRFDGDINFLGKELGGVRHDRGPAGKVQPRRRRAALLSAVKLHRLIHLDMQSGHELTRDFRDRRLVLVLRFFVSAPKADEAFIDFYFFGDIEFFLGFVGEVLRDGVGAEVNAARKNFSFFEEEQVAGFGPDIQQHGAIV